MHDQPGKSLEQRGFGAGCIAKVIIIIVNVIVNRHHHQHQNCKCHYHCHRGPGKSLEQRALGAAGIAKAGQRRTSRPDFSQALVSWWWWIIWWCILRRNCKKAISITLLHVFFFNKRRCKTLSPIGQIPRNVSWLCSLGKKNLSDFLFPSHIMKT